MYGYPATNNRVSNVIRNGTTTTRAFTYDGAGNILTDNRSGTTTTYTYNNRNRLLTAIPNQVRDKLGRAGVGLHLLICLPAFGRTRVSSWCAAT